MYRLTDDFFGTSIPFTFVRHSSLGAGRAISAADANALAQALSNAGLWNSNTPITTYNDAVASAVSGFQQKYAAEILAPNGLTYGTGFVGVSTRAQLNSLYGCAPVSTATGGSSTFQCPVGWSCTPPVQTVTQAPSCPAGWTCTPVTSTGTGTNPTNPLCLTGDYSWCYQNTQQPSAYSPVLTSVSPATAPLGGLVTLYGSGFSGATYVHIGSYQTGTNADLSIAPTSVSPDGSSLTFVVPSTITPNTTYTINVYNINGTNENSTTLLLAVTGVSVTPISGSQAPVISGVSGPTTLQVGQSGSWTIQASDPQNGSLSYSVTWGDNQAVPSVSSAQFLQTTVLDHTYYSPGTYTVIFTVTDSAGLKTSSSMTVQVGNQTTTQSAASANLSLDGSSPLANSINVTNTVQGQYLSLPVIVFDVNAQGDTLHLHSLNVSFNTSGNGAVSAAYLYQGSTPIASASVVNGISTFTNIVDGQAGALIPINTTVPFTVKADVTGLAQGSSEAVTASIVPAQTIIYSSIDSLVPVNGGATGGTQTVSN